MAYAKYLFSILLIVFICFNTTATTKLSINNNKSSVFSYSEDVSNNNYTLTTQSEEIEKDNLNRITIILSSILIIFLSLLTLSLYKNNNIRLHTNNMLQTKNKELIVAKEKAELASKIKANFLSTVTHELRTPLYAVTGLTNLLLDDNPKEDQIPHLESLKFSGEHLLNLINDILQVNKIEASKVQLFNENFNLKTKIQNIVSALENSAKKNNTKLSFNYDTNLKLGYTGDQLKISQILINLIGNAIKFTNNGTIEINVSQKSIIENTHTLKFEIKDNGIGISKEKQEKMFESFSQGSVQINRKYGGTGLGLSIVKGLINILNGKIWMESELDKGTTFFFEIPLNTISSNQDLDSKSQVNYLNKIKELATDKLKILVVEDNKINQMVTEKILNKVGLSCDIVDNGIDAVEIVKINTYNVVLMDIHMPGISGMEATKRIREFDKDLTIFALTAVTLDDKISEFYEVGFNNIISKPFKQEVFEKKLYAALSGKNEENL